MQSDHQTTSENMKEESKGLNKLYRERENFILIGLTGRIGSGCSNAVNILSSESFEEADLPFPQRDNFSNIDERKYKIIYDYLARHWKKFDCLRIRDIITSFILEVSAKKFLSFLTEKGITLEKNKEFINQFNQLRKKKKQIDKKDRKNQISISEKYKLFSEFYFIELPDFSSQIEDLLKAFNKTTHAEVYKAIGDNIRSSGKPTDSSFAPEHIFDIAQRANKLIKLMRKARNEENGSNNDNNNNNDTLFIIDSIKNPFEALFFRERYSAFYLISINTFDEDRKRRLRNQYNLTDKEVEAIDDFEHPQGKLEGKNIFVSQDVKKCIELSDIHLNNPQNGKETSSVLRRQLAWYITLMMHPGLVTPTSVERSMQIAYSVKQSSGCISRQVGAVITDQNYSIKAVGWNNTPEGQVPCLLRSVEDLLCHHDEEAFSDYELNDDDFHEYISKAYPKNKRVERKELLNGRNNPFCFKDIKNQLGNREKNQVHTRSLHAEENAFLQIAKHGGEGIKGGKLFTTASPCELCAKKAYQLGIEQIVYIDPYPGIATNHVLKSGTSRPKLDLFHGAIGRAYYQLYQPTLSFKDELSMLIDAKLKNSNGNSSNS